MLTWHEIKGELNSNFVNSKVIVRIRHRGSFSFMKHQFDMNGWIWDALLLIVGVSQSLSSINLITYMSDQIITNELWDFSGTCLRLKCSRNGKRGILKNQQISKGSFYVKYNLSSTLLLCLWYAVDDKSKSFQLIPQFI